MFNLKYTYLGGGILKGTGFYLPNLATWKHPGGWFSWMRSPNQMNLGPFQTIWQRWNQPFRKHVQLLWLGLGIPNLDNNMETKNFSVSGCLGVWMKKPLWWYQFEHVSHLGEVQLRNYQTCGRFCSFCSLLIASVILSCFSEKNNRNPTQLCWQMYISKNSRPPKNLTLCRDPTKNRPSVGGRGSNLVLRHTDPNLN